MAGEEPSRQDPQEALERRVAEELAQPAPDAVRPLVEAILARYGSSVASILFYGSCLRKQTHEGVLDFYVVVDGYDACYGRGVLALANRLLPPNVFYLERDAEPWGTLRCKYAVISSDQFDAAVRATSSHPYVWSRFAQPALLAFVRDEASRERAARAVARAVTTLAQSLGPLLPARGGVQRFSIAAFWQAAFRRTYGAEMRPEAEETIRGNYEAEPERYAEVGLLAFQSLEREGWLEEVRSAGQGIEVRMASGRRQRARWRWWALRPWARFLALLRLFKTATTFGDWLPYALWKLQRHAGVVIEPTERQRRHPLVFGWPVIFRLLLRRNLR